VLEVTASDLQQPFADSTLGEALLAPTRIYVKPLLELHNKINIHALAHITGGGLPENLPRVLPEGTKAVINADSWERPEIFNWLQQMGNIEESEMLRTFNCGVGMVICVAEQDADLAMTTLRDAGEQVWRLGHIEESGDNPEVIVTK
jgi:phosphoribosylformylglycinamidine cyclo-ligase